jgi:hypothetical protein
MVHETLTPEKNNGNNKSKYAYFISLIEIKKIIHKLNLQSLNMGGNTLVVSFVLLK